MFSHTHTDLNFQHIVTSNGEGKISYDLEELARAALLDDIDLFGIGEIKGNVIISKPSTNEKTIC